MDRIEQVLISLRRIIRAIDLHSRTLAKLQGLTTPQLIVMKEISKNGRCAVGELARLVSLSSATITSIVSRLESRMLVRKAKNSVDKRLVYIELTENGLSLLKKAPPLLQETFIQEFTKLKDWEQNLILSSIMRIADMMESKNMDEESLFSDGPIMQA